MSPTTGIHLPTSDHAQISHQFFKISPLPRPDKIAKVVSDRSEDFIFSRHPIMHTIGVKI
ncbi:MAG: hypothetical protein ICV54_10965 [Nostoc sp. C3-bin3]|nr:hypothetical protein [Nostoc sp. C3-bin3]